MENKPGYYAILPANVRYDKNLKPMEKIMYAEITALSNAYGYCTATNKYFADLYSKKRIATISEWISNLEKNGYIKVVLIYKPNSKEVSLRKLYPLSDPITEKRNTSYEKTDLPITEKRKDNITSINITSINNSLNTDTKLDNNNTAKDKTESNFLNSSVKRDIVFRLIGDLNISVDKIIKLNLPIERIKEVFKFARENNKGEGWIVSALKEGYKIENKPKFITKKRKVLDLSELGYHFEEYQVPCN